MGILKKFLFLIYIFNCLYISNALKREWSPCNSNKGSGSCQRVRNCPPALESMKRTGSPGLEKCGYTDTNDELVCCPSIGVKGPSEDVIVKLPEEVPSTQSSGSLTPTINSSKEFCEKIDKDLKSFPMFHIADGKEAALGEYPHMAALGYPSESKSELDFKCGATIITNKFLLTAAHCIRSKSQVKPKIARLGVTKLDEEGALDILVKGSKVHLEYHSRTKHNDIGLIELQDEIKFTEKVFPACLYYEDNIPSSLTVTGWGVTGPEKTAAKSNTLMVAKVNQEPNNDCQNYFAKRIVFATNITDAQFCAKYNTGDICSGDSGGPVQITKDGLYYVVGIISYSSDGCAKSNFSGVYTKVSKYIDWIDSYVHKN